MTGSSAKSGGWIWLAAAMAVAAVLYFWLIGERWVTPDEGAHAMSGYRALHGELPYVDYHSRQVIYTYIHALFQAVFGSTLEAGRIFMVLCTLGTALLIYRVTAHVSAGRAPLIASVLFLFSPLTIHYATVIQTQPPVILFSVAAVLAFMQGSKRGDWTAGALLALAYYVRESSLAVAAALILVRLLAPGGRGRLLPVARLAGGYLVVVAVVFAVYLPRWTVTDLVYSPVNPASMPMKILGLKHPDKVSVAVENAPDESPAAAPETRPLPVQFELPEEGEHVSGRPQSARYFRLAAGLILGAILAMPGSWWAMRRIKGACPRNYRVILVWLGVLGLFYLYWSFARGFYPGYLREFEPPIFILAAIALVAALPRSGLTIWRALLAVPVILITVAISFAWVPFWVSSFTLSVAGGIGLILLLLFGHIGASRWMFIGAVSVAMMIAVFVLCRSGGALADASTPLLITAGAMLLAAMWLVLRSAGIVDLWPKLIVALTFGGMVHTSALLVMEGGVDLHGTWPVPVVEEASAALEDATEPGDHVMATGMIWIYMAGREPFAGINHPLGLYLRSVDGRRMTELGNQFLADPPEAVVLDGLTERSWFKSSLIRQAVATEYEEVWEGRGKVPIRILVRRG